MMRLGVAVAIVLSFCVFAPMAGAQGQAAWKTIHTTGDPNITIEIPSGLDQEGSDVVHPEKGGRMAIFAEASETTWLFCILNRNEYSAERTRELWVGRISSSDFEGMCNKSGDGISNLGTLAHDPPQSTTSNGFPAGTCVSHYTDRNEKHPGTVFSLMAVAAPSALYGLICEASAEDQGRAIGYWEDRWKEVVTHMQGSLHLPDAKK